MRFKLINRGTNVQGAAPGSAFLRTDAWDDYSSFETQYWLVFVAQYGVVHEIGEVKIGQFGLKAASRNETIAAIGYRYPQVPEEFETLDGSFFSLGQSEEFYEQLNGLGEEIRATLLTSLRDVALDSELWDKAKEEPVMKVSLLRSVPATTVEGQFRRMALGGARVTAYDFTFIWPEPEGGVPRPPALKFTVQPESSPPTNIHVLVGRNGVGKTRLLGLMASSLRYPREKPIAEGGFIFKFQPGAAGKFANLIIVSFSAFDTGESLDEASTERIDNLNPSYIGLRKIEGNGKLSEEAKSKEDLAQEFVGSLANCLIGAKKKRWLSALWDLESDPMFMAADFPSLINGNFEDPLVIEALSKRFLKLSSGHAIVILTITKLVEMVEEKSLILMDEPEGHLHPPLLSAFIRALSNLLLNRNGVAIVATHSPVVVQEVPRSCVSIMRRNGVLNVVEPPALETFGENLGILTREVFRLELMESGFHKLLEEVARIEPSYEAAVAAFNGQLGTEAKAVLRALFTAQTSR